MTALTLVTLSLAKSDKPPVANTLPDLDCVGVTKASTGSMIPLKSDRPESAPSTANPLTRPTRSPLLTNME